MTDPATILCIDDVVQNVKLLEAVLESSGYVVLRAASGKEGLELVAQQRPDLVLLDIMMPEMDGYEVCRRIREDPATQMLPVVMITASGAAEKVKAIEAGADDFISKPFNRAELLARVRSLLRIKESYDTIQRQTLELADWNRSLEARVAEQVEQLTQLGRLRRFLSPQIADMILTAGDETILKNHRREIAVLFCRLSGFNAFAEAAEPEEVMAVLREFHQAMGALAHVHEATVGYFHGETMMVFFNDPIPTDAPAARAVGLGVAMRDKVAELTEAWRRSSYELGFGAGVSLGYATLGEMGFEGRIDYGVIGGVVNQASLLCEETKPGQVLVAQRAFAAVEDQVEAESQGELLLKDSPRPLAAFNILRIKPKGVAMREGGYPDGLSSREIEVLRLITAGKSNQGIADELVISLNTVNHHVGNIFNKTGAANRAEATSYAHRHALV